MEIFSLNNTGKKRIFISSNIPSSMSDKAFINGVEISDGQTTIILGLTDVIPGAKSNRIRRAVILNPSPPKTANDGSNLLHKGFGEENNGHIINWNGSKNGFDISKATGMVKLVSSNRGKLGTKFVNDESISLVLITMTENDRMPEMNGIRQKVRNREDGFNL